MHGNCWKVREDAPPLSCPSPFPLSRKSPGTLPPANRFPRHASRRFIAGQAASEFTGVPQSFGEIRPVGIPRQALLPPCRSSEEGPFQGRKVSSPGRMTGSPLRVGFIRVPFPRTRRPPWRESRAPKFAPPDDSPYPPLPPWPTRPRRRCLPARHRLVASASQT